MDFFRSFLCLFRPTKRIEVKKDRVLTFLDQIQKYIANEKDRLLTHLFTPHEVIDGYLTYSKNLNENMDPLFYQMEDYDTMLVSSDNVLENTWKKRILFESTPIGNVILYYNVYKRGFSYYSDVHITYPLLNAVAMKYVRVFFCKDLFTDDQITPKDHPSPLIALEQEYEKEKEKKEKKKRNPEEPTNAFKKGPFMKNKMGIQKVAGDKKNGEEGRNKLQHMYNVNKFIYMGKICNYSFTQKIEKRVLFPSVKNHGFQRIFDDEHTLQKEVFSYRDYKKMAR